jgi:hypothetical protein
MKLKTASAALFLLFCLTSLASAKELAGVTIPETLDAGGKQLVLNGAGIRKKFVIKVYVGALFLEQKNADAAAIIDADKPMAIRMHFVYDKVSAEDTLKSWDGSFNKSTMGNIAPVQKEIGLFKQYMNRETVKGDFYDMVYVPGTGLTIKVNGKDAGAIPGLEFKKTLFRVWLGDEPVTKELKEGMLGE